MTLASARRIAGERNAAEVRGFRPYLVVGAGSSDSELQGSCSAHSHTCTVHVCCLEWRSSSVKLNTTTRRTSGRRPHNKSPADALQSDGVESGKLFNLRIKVLHRVTTGLHLSLILFNFLFSIEVNFSSNYRVGWLVSVYAVQFSCIYIRHFIQT